MSSLVRKANAGPLADVPVNAAGPMVMVETRAPVSVLAALGREWRAAERHFAECGGRLPYIDAPLLVITAGETAANDPVQRELHDEFANHAPSAASHVLSGTTHEGIVMDSAAAHRVAQLSGAFIARLTAGADRGGQW